MNIFARTFLLIPDIHRLLEYCEHYTVDAIRFCDSQIALQNFQESDLRRPKGKIIDPLATRKRD
jgi:hypothetical protein